MPTREEMIEQIRAQRAVSHLLDRMNGDQLEKMKAQQGIFRTAASRDKVMALEKQILAGKDIDQVIAKAEPDVLVSLLKNLSNRLKDAGHPLIPEAQLDQLRKMQEDEEATDEDAARVMQSIPEFNQKILLKVKKLFDAIASRKEVNMMDYSNLAIAFAPSACPEPVVDPEVPGAAKAAFAVAEKNNKAFQGVMENEHFEVNPRDEQEINQTLDAIKDKIIDGSMDVSFPRGVEIEVDGQTHRVPHRVAAIYNIIEGGGTPQEKYQAIQEKAEDAIINPRLGQKQNALEFYSNIVDGKFEPPRQAIEPSRPSEIIHAEETPPSPNPVDEPVKAARQSINAAQTSLNEAVSALHNAEQVLAEAPGLREELQSQSSPQSNVPPPPPPRSNAAPPLPTTPIPALQSEAPPPIPVNLPPDEVQEAPPKPEGVSPPVQRESNTLYDRGEYERIVGKFRELEARTSPKQASPAAGTSPKQDSPAAPEDPEEDRNDHSLGQ